LIQPGAKLFSRRTNRLHADSARLLKKKSARVFVFDVPILPLHVSNSHRAHLNRPIQFWQTRTRFEAWDSDDAVFDATGITAWCVRLCRQNAVSQQVEAKSISSALKVKLKYRSSTKHRGKNFTARTQNHPAG
jgi:hypothetical protein